MFLNDFLQIFIEDGDGQKESLARQKG